jgi:NADH-quinone oxidoreductase subunit M
MSARMRLLVCLICALVVSGVVTAQAAPPHSGPNPNDPSTGVLVGTTTGNGGVEITTPYGQPLELEAHGGGFAAQFALRNGGAQPIPMKELVVRSFTDEPGQPPDPDLVVRVGEGAPGPFTLAPGVTRKVNVVWSPSKLTRVRQLYAQVLVQPDTAAYPLQVVTVHAMRDSAFPLVTAHPLGWLLLLPLLGALATALLALRGTAGTPVDPRIRLVGLAVTAAQLLLALYALGNFDPDLTRSMGNDGLQLVDRIVVSGPAGIELSLGVDGLGVVLVTVVALASFLALLVTPGADDKRLPTAAESRAVPLVLLVSAAAIAFFTVGDLVLLVLFGVLLAVTAVRLIAAEPTPAARAIARRVGATWALGLVLLAVAVSILRSHSGAGFLVDGTHAAHLSSIAELTRQGLVGTGALPQASVKATYALLIAAALLFSPLLPLGGGLVAAISPVSARQDGDGAGGALPFAGGAIPMILAGTLVPAGTYLLLRVVAAILPEAVRWSAPATAILGALLFLASALAASFSPSLRRRAALLVGAQSAAALLGLASLTQEGIAAAYLLAVAPAIALLFLCGCGLRAGSRGGRLVGAVGALFAAALIGPGAWGTLLAVTGAFPSAPVASVLGAMAFAVSAGVGAFGVCRALTATPSTLRPATSWSSWELGTAFVVLLFAAVLSVFPAGLMAPFGGALRDSTDRLDPPGPDQIASL